MRVVRLRFVFMVAMGLLRLGHAARALTRPAVALAFAWVLASTPPAHAQVTTTSASNLITAALNGSGSFTIPALPNLSSGFTVEAWVLLVAHQPYQRIIDVGSSEANNVILNLGLEGRPQLVVHRDGPAAIRMQAPDVLPLSTWSHVAAVMNGDRTASIYVNGQLVASGTATAMPSSEAQGVNFIGKSRWSQDPLLNGALADVRIWTTARTQAQIQANMPVGSITGATTGLAAAYPFGSTGSGVLSDVSGAGRHLTQSGNVTFDKSGIGTVTTSGLQGTAALNVSDGTLNLNATQTYTGGTVVNGGTLQLSVNGTDIGLIRGTVTVGAQGRLLLQGINALGFGSGVKVNTIHINGGLVETTAPNDQGWGVAYRMTGGELRATPGTMSRFSMGGGTTITTLASPTTATISGEVRIRDGNPGDVLPIDVADGPASPDLLITAHVQQQNITGGLTKTGAGTLALTGSAAYAGTITISGGTIDVGNGGASGSLGSGNVVNNGSLVVSRSSDITLNNTIVGSGSVTKTGAGTLTLTAFNSHSGGTFVNGGTLQLTGGEWGWGRIQGNVTVASGARLLISGPNNFGWDTGAKVNTVTIHGGLVENAAASGQGYGVMYRMTGGELRSNGGVSANGAASHYVMGGSGAGITTLASDSVATVSGGIWVREGNPGDQVPIDVADGAASPDLLISAAIDQANVAAGGIRKTGAGSLLLSGNNSYIGTTTISGGTLQVGNGGTTGSLSSGNVVNNASLVFNRSNDLVVGNAISGSGSVTKAGAGTLVLSGNNTFAGGLRASGGTVSITGSIANNAGNVATVDSGAVLSLDRHDLFGGAYTTVASPFVVEAGGTLRSGVNSATGGGFLNVIGPVTLNGGTLRSSGSHAIAGTLGYSFLLAGRVTVNGGAATSLIDGPGFTLGSGSVTSTTFDVADGSAAVDLMVSGSLGDGPSTTWPTPQASSLVKAGAGTMRLSGNNTYTGTTTISGGTLQVGAGGTTGSLSSGNVVNNATLVFNRSDAITVANAISGSGSLVKQGSGTLVLSAANTYSGASTISAGTLQVGNGGTSGSLGSGNVVNEATLAFNRSDTLTVSGAISGSGSLVKQGAGSLILSAANTYSGPSIISAGTLQVGNGGTSGSLGSGNVTNNATLAFNRSDTLTVSGAISGSGSLVKQGAGTLVLSAANTYSGASTISAGILQVGNGGTSGSLGSGNVTNNATLAFDRSDAITLANAISGSGSLVKQGAGTLVLSAANTYSGASTISAGTLQVGNGGTSGSLGSGNLTNNATLSFNRSDTLSVTNPISGTGTLVQDGTGTVTFGNAAPGGGTRVQRGTLRVNGIRTLTGAITLQPGTFLLVDGQGSLGSDLAPPWVTTVTVNEATVTMAGGPTQAASTGFILNGGRITGSANWELSSGTPANNTASVSTLASATTSVIDASSMGFAQQAVTFDVADGAANPDLRVSTAASGTGGLVKAGSGSMVVSGTNTYSGSTTVSGGTLALTGTGSIANSPTVTVASGATLDTSGLSSPWTLGASQTVANSGGTASLRGSLTATSGTLALSVDASTPAFSVSGGTLVLGASSTLRVTVSGTALQVGTYKLVSKGTGGSVSGPERLPVTVEGSGIASGLSVFARVVDGEVLLQVLEPVTITLGNLTQPYTGTARTPSATTDPPGLAVTFTYDGSSSVPVSAGSYAVVARVDDPSYAGTTNGTLVITKAPATISLGNLNQSYDGTPRRVVAVTDPSGLSWTATYNGATNAPSNLGFYPVVASISDPNYTGFTNGVLTVKAGNPGARTAATPQPPAYLNHHGFLTDASGNPLGSPNPRNYDLVFRVFSTASGGASLWTERQVVVVDEGEYDVMLGEGMSHGIEPWPAFDTVLSSGSGTARYLEVTVRGLGLGGSDLTLLPRFLLPSQPYAFLARHARMAEALVDSNASPVLRVSGTAVGIGVEQANATLDVGGVLTATDFASEEDTTVDGDYTAASFEGGGTLPLGCIIIWTGAAPPDGWALCDGSTVNNRRTPDLRSRFVLGHGQGVGLAARSVGQVGGAETTILTEAHFAAHRHVFDPPGTWSDGGGEHQHSYQTHSVGNFWRIGWYGQARDSEQTRTGGANRATWHGAHEHSVSISAQSDAAGGGQAHPNMPPFYVLAYIMRVQ